MTLKTWQLALSTASLLVFACPLRLQAQEAATASQAAAVIDLGTLPIPANAVAEQPRRLTSLSYEAEGGPRSGYAALAKTLGGLGWKELPGGYLDDQSCNGSFGKDGFTLSAMAMPAQAAGKVSVRLTNLGNVDLKRLPVPTGAKLMYSFPATTAYTTDQPADQVGPSLRSVLVAQGWAPYGQAGDALYFRKNAVKLTARPVATPAPGGKTMIQYSSELMSVELPAPAGAVDVAYADSTKALSFDVAMGPAALLSFYKEELGRSGWKATTETLIRDDSADMMVFRGPDKELLTLKMKPVDGKLRATLEHRTAAEFEEAMRRAEASDAKRKAASSVAVAANARARIRVAIPVPSGARNIERRNDAIRFKLAAGQGLAAVQAIRDAATRDGWKEQGRPRPLDATAGALSLEKGAGVSLVVVYIDPGFGDAEIRIDAVGADIGEATGGGTRAK